MSQEKKPRVTKQRARIFEKMSESALCWGYGDRGGVDYFFSDGTKVSAHVIEGMLRSGLLIKSVSVWGLHGQELVRR